MRQEWWRRPDWSLAALGAFLRRALLVPLLGSLGLYGCTMMAYAPAPADFPELRVEWHLLTHVEFKDKCSVAVTGRHHVASGVTALLLGATPGLAVVAAIIGPAVEACAELDFAAGACRVYFSADFPPADSVIRHERNRRCLGYDNIGDTTIRDAWAAYKHQGNLAQWRAFEIQRATRGW